MKKLLSLFTLIISMTAIASPVKLSPRATFDKLWVDYDVTDNGVKGMRIHVKFTAYEMKNMDAYLAIYFLHDDEYGDALKDKNDKFNSTDGDVAVYKSIKPVYDPAVYSDLQLFMPYAEFDLEPGNYDLTMDVKVIYKAGGTISQLTKYDFEYKKPGSTTAAGGSSVEPVVDYDKLWVDYDVTENGKKGLRIHAKFTLRNLKGVDCYLAIYFEKKDGEKLKSNNTTYRSKDGQLAVYKLLTPAYTDAVYDDAQVFIPYAEFDLPKGRKIDLKADADIIYKKGDLIKHMDYHEFWIEK